MDTRRDLDIFKDLVLLSIQELVDEEKLPAAVLPAEDVKPVEKRRRYMGICMKQPGTNNFVPFPCLRNGR